MADSESVKEPECNRLRLDSVDVVKYPTGFGMENVVAWGSTGLVVHNAASQTAIKTPLWEDDDPLLA
jgi:hypothetical protein